MKKKRASLNIGIVAAVGLPTLLTAVYSRSALAETLDCSAIFTADSPIEGSYFLPNGKVTSSCED
jgi:hypothetical protein